MKELHETDMKLIDCGIYIALLGIGSFLIGRLLPKRLFRWDAFPYKSLPFERDGRIYERLHISRWQKRLPDMSRIFTRLMPPKRISLRPTPEQLERMLQETCVAEFTHAVLSLAGLGLIKIWAGAGGWLVYAAYVLLGNLPFILIQRYNRPRLKLLLEKSRERERARSKRD